MFNYMRNNLAFGLKLPALLLFAVFFFLGTQTAFATNRGDDPEANARAEAEANASAQASATGTAAANAEAGDARSDSSASNDGNSLETGDTINNARSTFFSFARSMPAAGKCFGTIDGGGGDGGGAGFLGFNYLNKDCWYAALAAEEQNVEVRARLKCGSKKFRNAISYDYPRKERQQRCIVFMAQTYVDQLTYERAQLDEALLAQTMLINQHTTTETQRTSAQTTRAVERCTDCFGEKSK